MLKFATTLLTIFSVFTVSMNGPVFSQSASPLNTQAPARLNEDTASALTGKSEKRPDFKRIIDEETKKFESSSAEFDPLKYDDVIRRRQAKKKGLSTKDKVGIGLFIVGMAVLVILLVKYGKDCIRTSPADCTPGVDEFCTCEEYEQRK